MKMNLFDKFLLALVLVAALAASLFLGALALSLLPMYAVSDYLLRVDAAWQVNAYIIGAVALVLFVVTLRLFVASYRGDRGRAYTRLAMGENGEVAISLPTIKQIVATHVAANPDILASASAILPSKDGLQVRLRVCVKEGVVLPDITANIQKELKQHLITLTGLPIKEIGVLIDNNRNNYAGKG